MTPSGAFHAPSALRRALPLALLVSCIFPACADSQDQPHGKPAVLLDCYYNNEWRPDPSGHPVRFHYVWSDTTNSGFSILGGILSGSGLVIDTLSRAPERDALSRAAIYLIVDPDTPLETRAPNYIEPADVAVITRWVRDGGVLVLMGNDSGNAEFTHLNALASGFGIVFNEVSRNRVRGGDYGTGTFASFPDHPLFAGVRRIFIKEMSTLRLREPAIPVFSEGGDVIMALSRYGKGAVFAVGDPWFYNEYMDERRLPPGYDNGKAASNLFLWLLKIAGRGR